tara:strand:- start:1483 stop:2091 length:609 start_codon:yes stop_codon:yes gene_type:complete
MSVLPKMTFLVGLSTLLLASCASTPSNVDNICAIFEEKGRWYKAAKKSEERWGTPIHIQMAIIRQESSFDANAKPPRKRLLGFIPLRRPSNAFGYAQALDSTWKSYQADTGRHGADRDKFKDAIDFVGWYTDQSQKIAGISKWDPYNQYLAYHEGQGGWQKKTYSSKGWLINTAKRVDSRAKRWGGNLKQCESGLDKGWWIF